MFAPGPAKKVTIHLNEDTVSERDFLSREIVALLLREGVAGATLLRPEAGFGSHHRMHSQEGGIDTAQHMPLRIEFIDTEDNVRRLLPFLQELVTDGLIEAQDTTILKNSSGTGGMKIRAAALILLAGFALRARAQAPVELSLAQAQQLALRNHPRIASAELQAQAAGAVVKETRSAYYPSLWANATGVGVEHNSTLSAGALTTSSLFNRAATGVVANQLLSDFGRTSSLEQSAILRNASQNQAVATTRTQVLIEVQQAYYAALEAQSVLNVARAILDLRRLTLRQVNALAQSSLRSTLDVSFAQVNVSQSELDLFHAENNARASHARLSAAVGYDRDQPFGLTDESLPAALDPDVNSLIQQALRERPDLAALTLNRQALDRFADAEKRLRNPTISAAAVAGVAPVRDSRLPETYSAAGVNVSIPVLNGGLFKARREEAESREAAAGKEIDALTILIARDVQIAWLDANDAFRRLDVTARLVAEAKEALRLAQARYDNALGSIIELNQAQLNQTSAEIAAAAAKYEYLSRRAALNFAMGTLR